MKPPGIHFVLLLLCLPLTCYAQDLGRMGFIMPGPSAAQPAPTPKVDGFEQLPPIEYFLIVTQVTSNGVICDLKDFNDRTRQLQHEHYVLVKHYPRESQVIAGDSISISARRVGRVDIRGETSAVYDCLPPQAPAPTAEQIIAQWAASKAAQEAATAIAKKRKADAQAAALKFNQEQAAAGEAGGQYRMGKRYLTGDGVETNRSLAIDMFLKAAAQGHEGAKAELDKLRSKQ